MKRRVIKVLLLVLSLIPILTIIVNSFELKVDFLSNMFEYVADNLLVLLGLIPLFGYICMDFIDVKKTKGHSAFYKKIWKLLLIVGIVVLIVPFLSGIKNAIFGYKECFMGCSDNYTYGIRAFCSSMILYGIVLWPVFIVGLILILFSAIKLKKSKK